MESAAALGVVKAVQIPVELLTMLHLTGFIWPPRREVKNNTCFDYIVVGAGTAGSVIANRLTEDSNTVLALEAGDDPSVESLLPPLFVLAPMSNLDWNFTSTFNSYAASSQNNITKLTAGKALGGSSSINHFIFVRGAPIDFDMWADTLNDPSWNYKNVLQYFKKKENITDSEILASEYATFHGKDGPTGIARQPSPQTKPIVDAFNEIGNPVLLDVNGNVTIGYTQSLLTIAGGVRQSSAFSYLKPIGKRSNLYVLRNTEVVKIVFEDKRAVAVIAIRNGKTYVFRARKEIILCAGVFKTPQLLMLSGIGPKEHLESLKIKVMADLPVGHNYQDQVAVALVYRTEFSLLPPPSETIILTKLPFPVIVGLKALNPNQTYADYQTFTLLLPHDTPFLILACAVVFQYRPELCDKFNDQTVLHNSLFILVTQVHPKSRGIVRLNSTDPFDKPLIQTGFFTDKTDLDNMVEYIKDFIKVSNSTYFKEIDAKLINPELKQCNDYPYGNDDYWRCYALNAAVSPYHSTSTCPMGTVVDSKMKVFNVTNLRIVDASVMPNLTSGSPHETVLMIAEKAADMIKADSDVKPKCTKLYASAKAGGRCSVNGMKKRNNK